MTHCDIAEKVGEIGDLGLVGMQEAVTIEPATYRELERFAILTKAPAARRLMCVLADPVLLLVHDRHS